MPAGPYSEVGSRNGDWWEKPLTDAEGSAVTIVRTGGPVLVAE